MSNEWNWKDSENNPDCSEKNKDNTQENQVPTGEDSSQTAANPFGTETDQTEPAGVSGDDKVQEVAETEAAAACEGEFGEHKEVSASEPSDCEEQETVSGTYHWVNPRMQRNGSGQDNTFTASAYREHVGRSGEGNETFSAGTGNQTTQETGQGQWTQSGGPQGVGTDRQAQNGYSASNGNSQGGWNQNPSPTGQRRYGNYRMAQEVPAPKKTGKRPLGTGKKFLVTAGMAVVFGVIAGGIMFGINYAGNELTGANRTVEVPSTTTANQADASVPDTDASVTGGEFSVAQVAENAMPSVVSITNASVQTVQDFFGGVQEYPIQSAGSGIIVGQNEEELLIATNNHVVEGAQTLTVSFSDASSYEAQIKGNDAGNDLAVIAVKISDLSQETLSAIKVISLGDSDSLIIGEQVVAIGNALGYGQSVTSGWVSALDRDMTDEDGNVSEDLIQTDAAINPGNSGGALLNMKGELIGINVAKSSGNAVEGMGYAIPIAKAEPVLDSLMNRETRFKVDEDQAAYIGVTCVNVDSSVTEMYGIPEGAFVDSVEAGGPAEQAGIQANDVITEFDGIRVAGSQELVDRLEYYKAGETVDVVYARAENGEYQEHTVSVTLGKRSEMTQEDPAAER